MLGKLSAPPGLAILLAGFCLAHPVGAGQPSGGLGEAVQAAYARYPEAPLVDAGRRESVALRQKATHPLAADPAFNLKYQTDQIGSANGYREWEGGLELPLWLPGQRDRRLDEADAVGSAADALTPFQLLEVAGEVRERLWAAALARNDRDQAASAVASARELEKDVRRRVQAGEMPRSDLVLAEQEVLRREEALGKARAALDTAELRFREYTGLAKVPADIDETMPDRRELPADHAGLVRAEAEVQRAKSQRDRMSAERRAGPSLWLGGKTQRAESGLDYDSSVGIEITLPFGGEAHRAPELAAAETTLTQAQAQREQVRRSLSTRLGEALLEQAHSRSSLELAERRNELAAESLRLGRRAFELGETDLVRLLKAHEEAVGARHDLQARRLELGRAVARLNQALGVIPK